MTLQWNVKSNFETKTWQEEKNLKYLSFIINITPSLCIEKVILTYDGLLTRIAYANFVKLKNLNL